MAEDLNSSIVDFVRRVTKAMGLTLEVHVEETPDGVRLDMQGADGEVLLRRKGEPLQALQNIVTTAFRDRLPPDRRVAVDCLGFQRDKDLELRKMAQFLADRVKTSGVSEEIGPLNPYQRRIVHLAIAEESGVESESIGDAFMKTVIITGRK